MNLEERRDVAHGPGNLIGPARFDGVQPTFCLEVPPSCRRHYRVFAVDVPLGSESVAWTLTHDGHECDATPGHTGPINCKLDNTSYPADRGAGGEGGSIVPLVEFVEPAGSGHLGRARKRCPGRARLGESRKTCHAQHRFGPVSHIEEYMGEPKTFNAYWYRYQGRPGEVVFSGSTVRLEGGDTVGRKPATTTATFPAPGGSLLLVEALDSGFPSRCRSTNGYVQVTVVECGGGAPRAMAGSWSLSPRRRSAKRSTRTSSTPL